MRTSPRRLASLALLSALTLGTACNKDAASKDQDAQPEPGKDKDADGNGDSPDGRDEGKAPAPVAPAIPKVAQPATDSAPIADVGEVVGTAQLPSGAALTDISAAVDSFKPGTSMLLRMQLPTLLGEAMGMDLGGANLNAPMSIVVLDPAAHASPVALLVEVEDLDRLQKNAASGGKELRSRDKLALIGPADVVAAAESFAFDHLTKYPDHTEIVVYPRQLLTAFRPQLDAGLEQMKSAMVDSPMASLGSEMFTLYFQALTGMVEQTDRVVISVGVAESSVDLFMRMYPKQGSTFAAFTAAQTPADHALLAKLSGGPTPPALMSGTMQAGAAKDALIAWSVDFMASMYKTDTDATAWGPLLSTWLETFDGNFAMAIDMSFAPPPATPTMSMAGLLGATDAAAMRDSWRAMMDAMGGGTGPKAMMGMKFDMSVEREALTHDGVAIDLFSTELHAEGLSPEQQAQLEQSGATKQALHFATFDEFGLMASATDDAAAAKAAIDAARGKGDAFKPSPNLAAAIDASKANGESLIYFIDFASFLAEAQAPAEVPFSALVMGMGRHGQALSLRVSVRK